MIWQIESTYKAIETEEWLDIHFYRPLGYLSAKAALYFDTTPNIISLTGMFAGIIAGHLFYYTDLLYTCIGIILLTFSEVMDSADGQLARMTNQKSTLGRILDGFASNLIFISIYFHLSLRIASHGSPLVWLAALLAATSHSIQCAAADRYRNGYVNFVISPEKSELASSEVLKEQYRKLTWNKEPLKKFLTLIYMNYTQEQEMISPNFARLFNYIQELFHMELPDDLQKLYKTSIYPHIKYYNILTSNTRMIFLFGALLINQPWLFLVFEAVILNLLLIPIVIRQEHVCRVILEKISANKERIY